jgi:hypothetical protein
MHVFLGFDGITTESVDHQGSAGSVKALAPCLSLAVDLTLLAYFKRCQKAIFKSSHIKFGLPRILSRLQENRREVIATNFHQAWSSTDPINRFAWESDHGLRIGSMPMAEMNDCSFNIRLGLLVVLKLRM